MFHFEEEERYMMEHDYPGYKHHKALHEEFMKNIEKLKQAVPELEGGKKPGSYDLSVETNQMVVDWILEHISQVDRLLGKFLTERLDTK